MRARHCPSCRAVRVSPLFTAVLCAPTSAPTTPDTPSNSLRLLATASDHLTAARIHKANESEENRRLQNFLEFI
jgi:hypothetical protein